MLRILNPVFQQMFSQGRASAEKQGIERRHVFFFLLRITREAVYCVHHLVSQIPGTEGFAFFLSRSAGKGEEGFRLRAVQLHYLFEIPRNAF